MRSPIPNRENTGKSDTYKKVLGVLGICLATAGCKESEANQFVTEKRCRIIFEESRTKIHCLLPPGAKNELPKKLNPDQIRNAFTTRNEMSHGEVTMLQDHGGYFFDMARLPEMKDENPNTLGKVYMRFPDVKKGHPRATVFFHGNGGQGYHSKSEKNVISFTRAMQKEGDEVILISPEDGWGNFKHEGRGKDEPGNWKDFNNANTLPNLISFAERMYGHRIKDITLASFSGGNLGIMKVLRSLEKVKDSSPEMAELYKKIKRIAYFDSATGAGCEYLARWMTDNPEGRVSNAYNNGGIYRKGSDLLLEELRTHGIDSSRARTEKMKRGEGHGVYEDYFRRFTSR